MFLNKCQVISAFKIICVIFIAFMFFVFLRMTVVYERETLQEKLNQHNNAYTQQDQENYLAIKLLSANNQDPCKINYAFYYASALILGAYVNFKKLYKMGPI